MCFLQGRWKGRITNMSFMKMLIMTVSADLTSSKRQRRPLAHSRSDHEICKPGLPPHPAPHRCHQPGQREGRSCPWDLRSLEVGVGWGRRWRPLSASLAISGKRSRWPGCWCDQRVLCRLGSRQTCLFCQEGVEILFLWKQTICLSRPAL